MFMKTGCNWMMQTVMKDIVHVWTVLCPRAEPSDVELAELFLLGQFNVMAEVAVLSLKI